MVPWVICGIFMRQSWLERAFGDCAHSVTLRFSSLKSTVVGILTPQERQTLQIRIFYPLQELNIYLFNNTAWSRSSIIGNNWNVQQLEIVWINEGGPCNRTLCGEESAWTDVGTHPWRCWAKASAEHLGTCWPQTCTCALNTSKCPHTCRGRLSGCLYKKMQHLSPLSREGKWYWGGGQGTDGR